MRKHATAIKIIVADVMLIGLLIGIFVFYNGSKYTSNQTTSPNHSTAQPPSSQGTSTTPDSVTSPTPNAAP